MSKPRTPHQQYEVILELLRTRNLGGGQQGIMEWSGGKPGSEMPMSGDALKMALCEHDEWLSRKLVEAKLAEMADVFPEVYRALRMVFDPDTGAYRDLEYYAEHQPGIAATVEYGVWLLVGQLPPEDYELYVEPMRPMTQKDEDRRDWRNKGVLAMWREGKAARRPSGAVVNDIRETYGVSPRTVYQILEQQDEPSEEKRGRPRKKV